MPSPPSSPVADQAGRLSSRAARPHDAFDLAPRLRDWDRFECRLAGRDPFEALCHPFRSGLEALTWALDCDGEVAGLGGVAPQGEDAAIWYLGAELPPETRADFLRLSRPWVDAVSAPYRMVGNTVPANHRQAIRWLRYCGFDFTSETMHLSGVRILHFCRKGLRKAASAP